jgi:hypothetical protein
MSAIMVWGARLLRNAESEVRPVIEKRLEAGAVLFRAGDPCPGVALIREGAIELLADVAGVPQRMGMRGKGSYVGDDAILGGGICLHTAVALSRTTVEMLARDVLLKRHGRVGAAAPDRRLARSGPIVHMAPASAEGLAAMPSSGIEIHTFPFVVGRASVDDKERVDRQRALLLDDHRPFRLSRRQFLIIETPTGIALSDPGSRLGTFVDGERLGMVPHELPSGQIVEVSAGGSRSPFRFQLRALHPDCAVIW